MASFPQVSEDSLEVNERLNFIQTCYRGALAWNFYLFGGGDGVCDLGAKRDDLRFRAQILCAAPNQ